MTQDVTPFLFTPSIPELFLFHIKFVGIMPSCPHKPIQHTGNQYDTLLWQAYPCPHKCPHALTAFRQNLNRIWFIFNPICPNRSIKRVIRKPTVLTFLYSKKTHYSHLSAFSPRQIIFPIPLLSAQLPVVLASLSAQVCLTTSVVRPIHPGGQT